MSFLHRLFRIILLAVVVACSMAAMAVAVSPVLWRDLVFMASAYRLVVLSYSTAVFCLAIVYALTGLRRRETEKFLSFEKDGGRVSISTTAIADYVARLSDEFPSIVRMAPRVVAGRGNIGISIDLRVRAGSQVSEICETVQQRVRESVVTGLGITQIGDVTVTVRGIASEHKRM